MNNYAPEIINELVEATFAGDVARSEKVYMVMMELSKKMHFTDSTIASHVGLYARGFLPNYSPDIILQVKSHGGTQQPIRRNVTTRLYFTPNLNMRQ
ncbi:MAG: hypothetical protein ACNA8H_14200 [Anaerolineales bacterium]